MQKCIRMTSRVPPGIYQCISPGINPGFVPRKAFWISPLIFQGFRLKIYNSFRNFLREISTTLYRSLYRCFFKNMFTDSFKNFIGAVRNPTKWLPKNIFRYFYFIFFKKFTWDAFRNRSRIHSVFSSWIIFQEFFQEFL